MLARRGDPGRVDGVWSGMADRGLAPDLARLRLVGRAITPSFSRLRFHARFFLADARHVQGDLLTDGELEDLRWIPFAEAKRLPLVDVTELMIDVAELLTVRPALARGRGYPVLSYRDGAPLLRFHGGPPPDGIDVAPDKIGLPPRAE